MIMISYHFFICLDFSMFYSTKAVFFGYWCEFTFSNLEEILKNGRVYTFHKNWLRTVSQAKSVKYESETRTFCHRRCKIVCFLYKKDIFRRIKRCMNPFKDHRVHETVGARTENICVLWMGTWKWQIWIGVKYIINLINIQLHSSIIIATSYYNERQSYHYRGFMKYWAIDHRDTKQELRPLS